MRNIQSQIGSFRRYVSRACQYYKISYEITIENKNTSVKTIMFIEMIRRFLNVSIYDDIIITKTAGV